MKDFSLILIKLALTTVLLAMAASVAVIVGKQMKNDGRIRGGSSETNPEILQTEIPTSAPTSAEPTVAPTTAEPTLLPSANPTGVPSIPPSDVPSLSFSPSQLPTFGPTASQAPTFEEFDSSNRFRLKMHWEDGYFWQDEVRERFFCVSCMRCFNITFTEYPEDLNCTDSRRCAHGDQLWLRKCGMDKGVYFKTVNVDLGMMLALWGKGTCVNRVRRDFVDVETCNASSPEQMWRPISLQQPFELKPAYEISNDHGYDYCISQVRNMRRSSICFAIFITCRKFHSQYVSLFGTLAASPP